MNSVQTATTTWLWGTNDYSQVMIDQAVEKSGMRPCSRRGGQGGSLGERDPAPSRPRARQGGQRPQSGDGGTERVTTVEHVRAGELEGLERDDNDLQIVTMTKADSRVMPTPRRGFVMSAGEWPTMRWESTITGYPRQPTPVIGPLGRDGGRRAVEGGLRLAAVLCDAPRPEQQRRKKKVGFLLSVEVVRAGGRRLFWTEICKCALPKRFDTKNGSNINLQLL